MLILICTDLDPNLICDADEEDIEEIHRQSLSCRHLRTLLLQKKTHLRADCEERESDEGIQRKKNYVKSCNVRIWIKYLPYKNKPTQSTKGEKGEGLDHKVSDEITAVFPANILLFCLIPVDGIRLRQ
jgi:hypothetical protein